MKKKSYIPNQENSSVKLKKESEFKTRQPVNGEAIAKSQRPEASAKKPRKSKPFVKKQSKDSSYFNESFFEPSAKGGAKVKRSKKHIVEDERPVSESMPLNKFIAHCGVCSRRDAVDLIKKGKVKVNGLVEVEPGTKILPSDFVIYDNKRITPKKDLVYYLLNKPKDYITTTDDPKGRKTVLDLFRTVDARIFPVGRLDRNTTGLLLLTNDGELAQKLAHPKNNVKKVYQVGLDKPLTKKHFEDILKGVTLEDGKAQVDELAFTNPEDKKEIGIQIHSGRNRIVRRIFESLGYKVKTLDRVLYAGLTKKNLPRGKWRLLLPKEVVYLKHY